MAVNYQYAGPEIVSDGLVLYLDAANPNSYNLSRPTVFKDVSRKNNNATLINRPTYNSLNSGSLVYNGTNNYTQVNSAIPSISSFTVCVWFYPTAIASYNNILDCYNINNVGPRLEMNSSGNLAWLYSSTATNSGPQYYNHTIMNSGLAVNTWHHICITYDSSAGIDGTSIGYYNGLAVSIAIQRFGSVTGKYVGSMNNITIGTGFNLARYFAGRISQTVIYNRALSASEILKNYNSTKSRYGL